jgi:hypothetical protein
MVIGINQERVILQFCTWHGAEAIKRKLTAKGYTKERREKLNHLIWAWIKAPDLSTLEDAREELILNLNITELEEIGDKSRVARHVRAALLVYLSFLLS